jgi:perilipin-2
MQIVKDPKEAVKKAGELWQHLSKDEPGNQQRPKTLEQLIILVTRESARKVVHIINYTSSKIARIPG